MLGPLIVQIHDEARRIWCFKWLALMMTTLLLLVGAAIVLKLPNVYEAWAQIYVAKATPLGTAAQGVGLVNDGYGDPYVVERTLLNDQSLEALLHRLDPASLSMSKGQTALAVAALKAKIRVAPSNDDGFFELHVLDSDPIRARNTVQWLIDEFLSRNLSRNQDSLGEASRFLDEQIATYRQMLAESDAKLGSFRARHPAVAAAGAPATIVSLAGAPLTQPNAAGPTVRNTTAILAQADERIATLNARLTALSSEYTDEHPDVAAARRQLAIAVAQRAETALRAPPEPPPSLAPAGSMASVQRARVRAPAGASAAALAEWASLSREDLMLRTNYDQLLARREAARMSEAAYGGGSGKYQVTRPPTAPQFPIGPNRKLYLAAVAVLASVGGLASAFVYAAMKGIFVSPRELEMALGLPVAGTVSWEPAWSTKRSKVVTASPQRGKLGRGRKSPLPYDPTRAPWGA